MTLREKAIIEAHTGVRMLGLEDFAELYKYIVEIMGRPVSAHELSDEKIVEQIKQKSRMDFVLLRGKREEENRMDAKKPEFREREDVIVLDYADGHGEVKKIKYADWVCPTCGWSVGERYIPRLHSQHKSNYCSRCGQAIDWTAISREEMEAAKKQM